MSALRKSSTVVSGGFAGRLAREVNPNPKCHGCLHYDGQAGRVGVCTLGSQPYMCGEGDAQDIGYAPIARGAGSYLPDLSNHAAQAREVETQPSDTLFGTGRGPARLPVHEVSLGEERVHFVKSFVEQHAEAERRVCRLHQGHGTPYGTQPFNVDPQDCTCEDVTDFVVAKALTGQLSNRERVLLTFDDLVAFVAGVRRPDVKKARPAPKKKDGDLGAEKSLTWAKGDHAGSLHAEASHGGYVVVPTPSGHAAAYYPATKGAQKQHLGFHGSRREAIGAATEHHLATKKSLGEA